jgi:hypothetical protein
LLLHQTIAIQKEQKTKFYKKKKIRIIRRRKEEGDEKNENLPIKIIDDELG